MKQEEKQIRENDEEKNSMKKETQQTRLGGGELTRDRANSGKYLFLEDVLYY